jgi:hypothetical protein
MLNLCHSGLVISIAGLITIASKNSNQDNQGIEGHVYRISGNQMPSPDLKPNQPGGAKTTLYIFDLTSLNQVSRQGQSAFYYSVQTKLVKKVQTDSSGYFKVSLAAGQYSLFVKKNSLYFANWFDGSNHIAPIEVLAQKITKIDFRIDYDAHY